MAIRKQLIGAFAAALLGTTALAGAPAMGQEFVILGDSLSDNGNLYSKYGPDGENVMDNSFTTFYTTAPFSTGTGAFSDGLIWNEYLSDSQGAGLNNLAFSGASTGFFGEPARMFGTPFGIPSDANAFFELPTGVLTQVAQLLTDLDGGQLGENDVAFVWAGANNYFFGSVFPNISDNPITVVSELATAVSALSNDAGAQTIVVINLPDLSSLPLASIIPPAVNVQLGLATLAHNALLDGTMDGLRLTLDADIIVVDVFAAFNQIVANPERFGFTNVTDSCITVAVGSPVASSTGLCVNSDGNFDADGFLFWDRVHPTTAGHELTAEFVAATMRANAHGIQTANAVVDVGGLAASAQMRAIAGRTHAANLGVSGFGLLGNGFAGASRLEQRLAMAGGDDGNAAASEGIWMPLSAGAAAPSATAPRLSMFVYRNSDGGTQATTGDAVGFGYSTETQSIGMDYRLGDKMLVGMAYGQTDALATIEGGALAELVSDGVAVYGAYTDRGFFANAQLGVSEEHYAEIARETGSRLFPVAAGGTDGRTSHADFETGYGFTAGPVTFGPSVGVRWTRSEIDGYGETGAGPLNLTYGDQTSETVTGRLGFQAAAIFETATGPLAAEFGATWSRGLAGGGGAVSASLPDGYTKSLTGVDADGDIVDFNAGAAMSLAPGLTGLVELRSSFGAAEGESHEARASVTLRF